jgi:hypothetical protein
MTLKGNLRDFTLLQLFNLINLAAKTGSLILETSDDRAQLAFRVGKLAYASVGKDDASLAGILLRGNKINAVQYRIIHERGTQISDQELGLLLINAGYFAQDDILSVLHDLEKIRLNPEEWKVVNYVNPKNTLRQISRTLHLSEMEIRRIIYALLQAGIVELIRPAGLPVAVSMGSSQTTPVPVVSKPQQSLVNRLINRIRSL